MRLRLSAVSKMVKDALTSDRISLNLPSASAIAKVRREYVCDGLSFFEFEVSDVQ